MNENITADRFRDRKFRVLLYPEDPTHLDCIQMLMEGGYSFAAILHDKDVDESGELKKAHWHVVVRFQNAVWNSALADKLKITDNYIQECKNLDKALAYLVHYGYPEKYQYDLDEVFGSLKPKLGKLLLNEDPGTRALRVKEIIDNIPGIATYTEVFTKACLSGLYGEFRLMGVGVKYLIDEHNMKVVGEL